MADMEYISAFLAKVEGTELAGYVPCHKRSGGTANYKGRGDPAGYIAMGHSGVTIATGCDLGQTNAAELAGYGIRQSIINIYAPYLGRKQDAALARLHERPFSIREDVAIATDAAVHGGYLDRWVAPAWEKASGCKFSTLPVQAQAVIMSVCFQKGCGGVRRDWPKTWKLLCACDWQGAAFELMHGITQYRQRRACEGRLLLEIGK